MELEQRKNMEHLISLTVEPYLAQWAHNALGNPVQLPKESPESKIIKRFLDRQPTAAGDKHLQNGKTPNLYVLIPYSKDKDPRMFNYLPPAGKAALEESFDRLFTSNMWKELGSLDNLNCSLTNVIYAYMQRHGIDEDHWETIRQKFYRLRRRYKEKGIDLAVAT